METKREKFVRLAEARTNRVIDTLKLIENLSNKGSYDYSKKDADQMFKAIEEALNEAKKKFDSAESKEKKRFSFEG